ncbi:hypothetical protein [Streptomyces sp. NPDC002671]
MTPQPAGTKRAVNLVGPDGRPARAVRAVRRDRGGCACTVPATRTEAAGRDGPVERAAEPSR